jgi:TRAP-type C4-dicarboxylate transport system substrate-binding protein
MIKAMGAAPPIPFGEVCTALRRRPSTARENPIPTIFSRKFYEVQAHLSMTRHMLQNNTIVISKRSLEKLSRSCAKVLLDGPPPCRRRHDAAAGPRSRCSRRSARAARRRSSTIRPRRVCRQMAPAYQKLESRWGSASRKQVRDTIDAGRAKVALDREAARRVIGVVDDAVFGLS